MQLTGTVIIQLMWDLAMKLGEIDINENRIKATASIKYLGVIIDNKLMFEKQVSAVLAKMAIGIQSIRHIAEFIPVTARMQLVHALVLSHLKYACILYNSLSCRSNTKLQRQLNWALRVCFQVPRYTSGSQLHVMARMINFDHIVIYSTLCKFSRLATNSSRPFQNLVFPNFTNERNTRTGTILTVKYKKCIYKNSFLRNAIEHWNTLPKHIQNKSLNYMVFKLWLQNHLLLKQCSEAGINVKTVWKGFKIRSS